MADRILSGSAGLDLVLGGGLLRNATNLIIGRPGSGKTILAQQYLFRNTTVERPGLYFSTVSEPLDRMLRFAEGLSFFDRRAIGRSVFFEDLSPALHANGLTGAADHLGAQLLERRPALVVIDSFKALRPYAATEEEYRRFLHTLAAQSLGSAMTSFWVGEYGEEDGAAAPEAAVADAILLLSSQTREGREMRIMRVVKLRGSGFRSGQHVYRISPQGLEVYARFADPVDGDSYDLERGVTASGVPGLDEILGGFPVGCSTLVLGPAGVGKTVLGLHFILGGAARGEPGVIATLQENPSQLERTARGFGMTLNVPGVTVLYETPVDLYLDQWVHELLDCVERTGARRVVVDSMDGLIWSASDAVTFREAIYSLAQRLSRAGVALLMTQETPDLFGAARTFGDGFIHVADNVLLMNFVNQGGLWTRAVTVLKSRGQSHSSAEAPFRIIDRGMELVPGGE